MISRSGYGATAWITICLDNARAKYARLVESAMAIAKVAEPSASSDEDSVAWGQRSSGKYRHDYGFAAFCDWSVMSPIGGRVKRVLGFDSPYENTDFRPSRQPNDFQSLLSRNGVAVLLVKQISIAKLRRSLLGGDRFALRANTEFRKCYTTHSRQNGESVIVRTQGCCNVLSSLWLRA